MGTKGYCCAGCMFNDETKLSPECYSCITSKNSVPSHYKPIETSIDIDKFMFDNMIENVTILTKWGIGYIGRLICYKPGEFVYLATVGGSVSIPYDAIVKCYISDESGTEILPSNTSKMSPERFKELLDELDGNSLQTLKEKNARYSTDGDCLHNFRSGAEIVGGTPAQACWGYMTKHLVALRDMVEKDDFSNREDFLEKCQDTINYIRFLWCIGNDASNSEINEKESK